MSRMDLRVIARAGERRRAFLSAADGELDKIVSELIAAGELANVKLAGELAEIPRSTLYRRLYAVRNTTPTTDAPAPAPADTDPEDQPQ